jgi:hypothetical protein
MELNTGRTPIDKDVLISVSSLFFSSKTEDIWKISTSLLDEGKKGEKKHEGSLV